MLRVLIDCNLEGEIEFTVIRNDFYNHSKGFGTVYVSSVF